MELRTSLTEVRGGSILGKRREEVRNPTSGNEVRHRLHNPQHMRRKTHHATP